jgi:predicted N-acetyltransferase YhbS
VRDASFALLDDDEYIGMIVMKAGESPHTFHVGLIHVVPTYRCRHIARRMFDEAASRLNDGGDVSFITGTEPDCLFSGVPTEAGRSFFRALGFKKNRDNMNLIAHHPPKTIPRPDDAVDIMRAETEAEKEEVRAINDKHFSVRWAREVDESAPHDIFVLKKQGRIIGYVRTGFPDGPVLPYSLNFHASYDRLGGIGPLGLLPEERGHGYGAYMVNHALSALFAAGASDVMVDWTGLETFYRKCGFEAIHSTYVVYEKRSDER